MIIGAKSVEAGVHVKAVSTSPRDTAFLSSVSSNAKSLCLFHQPLYGGFV